MNRIEDDRVLFYLKHQQRIDEWAALAKEASDAAHRFLCSCSDDIAALAADFGSDVRTLVLLDDGYPKIFLYRANWGPGSGSNKYPRVGIGLEWFRSNVSFSGRGKTAYSGVWVHYQMDGGAALQGTLSRIFRDSGLPREHKLESSRSWWPTYRYEQAQRDFWTDLMPYRVQLVDSVRFFWKTFAPLVQEAMP